MQHRGFKRVKSLNLNKRFNFTGCLAKDPKKPRPPSGNRVVPKIGLTIFAAKNMNPKYIFAIEKI